MLYILIESYCSSPSNPDNFDFSYGFARYTSQFTHMHAHIYNTNTYVYDEWICLGFLYEKSHWNRQWWSRRRMNHHHTFAYTMLTFTTHSHCMQVQTTGAVVGWSSKQTHIYIYRNICILKYTRTHTHALVCIRTGRERELESSQF